MKIKIEASQRLSAAKADEALSQAYVESLGVKVHSLENSRNGRITFLLEKIAVKDAMELITKKLGQPTIRSNGFYSWKLGTNRSVTLEYAFGSGGMPTLTLDDAGE